MADLCSHCGDGRVIFDRDSSAAVCTSCGLEHSTDPFSSQAAPFETSVLLHSVGELSYNDRKIYHSKTLISDLASRLGLSSARSSEITALISDVTDSSFGSGAWFSVLAAAASYVVMRRHRLPLSLSEVAAAAGCEDHQVGQMVSRIINHLDLGQLPEFDAVQAVDRAVKNSPCFRGVADEKVEEVAGMGRFLMRCAVKWFLTTGRRPMPVVAAVAAFAAEVNGVGVGVDEIASEVYAGVTTSRLRLRELKETLVRVARKLLPWGKDVDLRNLIHNAQLLIRIMELKSKSKLKSGEALDGFEIDFDEISNLYSYANDDEDSKYFKVGCEGEGSDEWRNGEISEERLLVAYKNVSDRIRELRESGGFKNFEQSGWKRGLEIEALMSSWEGRWGSNKKLRLEEVLETDVGYDALPPSFVNGVESRMRRRERIEAAKRRINETMKSQSVSNLKFEAKAEECDLKPLTGSLIGRKRRRRKAGITIDWEDCIIELLLLHRVDEDEIENGQYNRLLDLHVFNYLSTER